MESDREEAAEFMTELTRALAAGMAAAVGEVMRSPHFSAREIATEEMLGALLTAAGFVLAHHLKHLRELGLNVSNAQVAGMAARTLSNVLPSEAH